MITLSLLLGLEQVPERSSKAIPRRHLMDGSNPEITGTSQARTNNAEQRRRDAVELIRLSGPLLCEEVAEVIGCAISTVASDLVTLRNLCEIESRIVGKTTIWFVRGSVKHREAA